MAFTLAEVLITLGIIGIVSAATIPIMLTNFKKRETVAKVKAAYSILSQAVKLSVEENGKRKQKRIFCWTGQYLYQKSVCAGFSTGADRGKR